MQTPLQAMIWELWRTSRGELLIRIGWLCIFVLLAWCVPVGMGANSPAVDVINGVLILMLMLASIASPTWMLQFDRNQAGFSFRLGFVRPVSTTVLVVVPTVYTMVTAAICFLVPETLLGLLRGTFMPIVGPAVVIASIVACFTAATWSPTTVIGKMVGLAGVIGGAVWLVVYHSQSIGSEPLLMALGKSSFFDFGWQIYVVFFAVTTLALVATVVAVDRQRHGDRWRFGSFVAARVARLRGRQRTLASPTTKPFASRFAAQCWYEMRRYGSRMLVMSAFCALLVLALVSIVPLIQPRWQGGPIVWLMALALCPFVYQIIGADGALGLRQKQGATRFPAFDATRAMSNDRLIACKLLVIAACSLIGWLGMGIVAGLHTVVAGDWQMWGKIGETVSQAVGGTSVTWWIAGISSAALLYISSTVGLLALGLWLPSHPRLFQVVSLALYLQIALMIWDARHDWSLRPLWVVYGYTIALTIVVGCVVALKKAILSGFLGKRLFGCVFCLWGIYAISIITLYLSAAPATPIPTVVVVLAGSSLLIPLAAVAFAPLALASYRHA